LELRTLLIETFHGLFSWKRAVVAIVIVTGILLTVLLAGTVPPQNIRVVNGNNYLAHIYTEGPNPSVGYSENLNTWSFGSGTQKSANNAQLNTVGVTTLSGTFKPSSSPTSIQISRSLSVNITRYPIMFLQISVTQGVGYGIRFYSSTADNRTLIPLWNNSDFLNHRIGTGNLETIQVNMQLLSKTNIGVAAENITQLQLYVERGASSTPLPFSMQIQNLEFLNYHLEQFVPNQNYHSVYFTFDSFPSLNSSWVLNKIDLSLQLQATPGTSYVFYQLNGSIATVGSVYKYSPTTSSYQYSLYPKGGQKIFSDAVPPSGNFSIVVIALNGALTQAKLQNASFVFTPAQTSLQAAPTALSGIFWYAYLVFMLFLLPLLIALLLYLKAGELKPRHITLALATGIVCRFALAPVAMQPFDIGIYATSARGWFEYGVSDVSLGPTLPFTFFLYWVPYSFYALLVKLGFHDFYILNHQTGFVESFFLKGFPIAADCFVTYLIFKFNPEDNRGKVLAIFYFLNPLSIYISSVWGQYEAATVSFIVLGFFFMSRASTEQGQGSLVHDLSASLSFAVSALIELVGLIPFLFLFLKSLFSRPIKIANILLVFSPVLLLFAYPPQWHLIYLIAAAALGASSTLLLAQPHTPYTIFSNFPQLEAFHPLIIMLVLVLGVFLWKRRFDLRGMVSITLASLIVFLLFAAQQPQWWIIVLPVGLIYAIVSENYGVGPYVLAFGAMTAFLILSFTQGSGYLLFGSPQFNLLPQIENAKHGIDVYTLTTTVGGLAIFGYLLAGNYISGTRPLLRGSLYLAVTFLASFLCFSVVGLAL